MMTHDEMIAVIQHHKNGGKVEWAHSGQNDWSCISTPSWDFNSYDYRVKTRKLVIFAEVSIPSGTILRTSVEPLFHKYDNTTIKKFIEEEAPC